MSAQWFNAHLVQHALLLSRTAFMTPAEGARADAVAQRDVLVSIARHANTAGERSFPSLTLIASETFLPPSTVEGAIADLEYLGFIASNGRLNGGRGPAEWRISLANLLETMPPDVACEWPNCPSRRVEARA